MPYLILKTVTAKNVNEESFTHQPGTVVSDWEVSQFIRDKIKEGSVWYRSHFEPLTQEEAQHHRVKATATEGARFLDGQEIPPPWSDYIGLHPEEIIGRMKDSTNQNEVTQIKAYERAGMNRSMIMDFTAPVEREPFTGYDELHIRDILAKLAVLSDRDVTDVIQYEGSRQNRPAIMQYERESYEASSAAATPAASTEAATATA